MGVSSVVYVPKFLLPLNSWEVCALLRYDDMSYQTFTDNGIPDYVDYIDADVVASAAFSIVSDLPGSLDEFLEYYSGDSPDPERAALSEFFSVTRKLRFLSDLYNVLHDTAAIILPDTANVSDVLSSDYPFEPSDFVELRAWVEDSLKGGAGA